MTGATSRALIPPVIPGRAERREPGIHNRRPWLSIPGSLAALGPRNDREDARPTQNISALLKDLPLPRRHTPCCEAAAARRLAPRWPRRPIYPSLAIPVSALRHATAHGTGSAQAARVPLTPYTPCRLAARGARAPRGTRAAPSIAAR